MNLHDPVSTIMTKGVIVANQFHNFSEVIQLFSKNGMHHLPVVDGKNHIIGIISSNDLMKLFTQEKFKNLTLDNEEIDKAINIPELMTPNPITVSSKDTIRHAAKLFAEYKFNALPVVDNGEIVGIVSTKDIIHLAAYF